MIEGLLKWLDYSLNGDVRSASIERWQNDAKQNPYRAYLNLRDTPVRYHGEALACLDNETRAKVTAFLSSDSTEGDEL